MSSTGFSRIAATLRPGAQILSLHVFTVACTSATRFPASFFPPAVLSRQFLKKLNNERASIQFSEEHRRQRRIYWASRLMGAVGRICEWEIMPLSKFYLFRTEFYLLPQLRWESCASVNASFAKTFRLILASVSKIHREVKLRSKLNPDVSIKPPPDGRTEINFYMVCMTSHNARYISPTLKKSYLGILRALIYARSEKAPINRRPCCTRIHSCWHSHNIDLWHFTPLRSVTAVIWATHSVRRDEINSIVFTLHGAIYSAVHIP